MNFSEKWGKDVEEAVRLALIDLQLTRDEVKVIVLEEPTKGFFGIGSKLAKVRVEKKADEKPQPQKKAAETTEADAPKPSESKEIKKPEKKIEAVEAVKKEKKEEGKETKEELHEAKFSLREKPSDLKETEEGPAVDFLTEVMDKMGLNLSVKVMQNDSNVYVDIKGKDSGTIIGKRGQTLDAIQYLTSLVVNKDKEKYVRVIVDAENYREKREKTLEQLAARLADKVLKTNRTVRLEPMNPYERKVIHATLQSNPKVTTRSEGEEPFRRVIIERK